MLPNLQEDLKTNKDLLLYYNSIEKFLSEYGEKISFINLSSIQDYLNKNHDEIWKEIDLNSAFRATLENISMDNGLQDIRNIDIKKIEVLDYYIYGSTDKIYNIQADICVYLEMEVAIYAASAPDFEDVDLEDINVRSGKCWMTIPLNASKKSKEIKYDPKIPFKTIYPIILTTRKK